MGVHTLSFTENATTVLERRYLAKNAEGQVIETPETMLRRVARALASADQLYTLNNDTSATEDEFYRLMASLDFLPNSPTLMNAGTAIGQLSACFVLPVEDSMDKIFEAVRATALIHQSGGGCVASDAHVYTTFCGVERISTLYERVRALGMPVVAGDGHRVMDVTPLGIHTFAMDPETGRFACKQVTHLWQWDVPAAQQYTVRCSGGTEVTTSAWHPFMVFTAEGITERRADQLKPGDILLAPNRSVRDTWPFTAYHESEGYRLDERLAWLVGYFVGDGSLDWFHNRATGYRALRMRLFDGRPESIHFAVQTLADYGVNVAPQQDNRGLWRLSTTNQAFVPAFARLAMVTPGPKKTLTLPEWVAKSPLSVIGAFLGGLIDSDGHVSLQRRRVEFTTVCPDLAQRLVSLLSALGLNPSMREKQPGPKGKTLEYSIHMADAKKTPQLVSMVAGWVHDPIKKQRLTALSERLPHNTHDRIPLPFAALADLLKAASIEVRATAIHKGPVVVAGERIWLHHPKWGWGIGEDKLHRLVKALRKVLPTTYARKLDQLEQLADGWMVVEAVGPASEAKPFYDLTVADYNNYLAGSGHGKLAVVHNTGFSFSRLRPAGDIVGSTGGIASGPVSFMRVFDTATDVIKQGGRRRGANMGILRVDHPDIEEFITCKHKEGMFANFNISVAVTDAFMQALSEGAEYDLVNPRNGRAVKRLRAADVFDRIVEGTWRNGEPGVVFIDRMNAYNPTPQLGDYEATNPCGEQILLPWESCNLGSINLAHMVTPQGTVDWERLRYVVRLAVHMMDNVITINRWPLPEIGEATLKTRKIGLGVMGFADMLLALNVPYDSIEAETVASRVMEAISYWSKEASCELAMSRGAFPAFPDSRWASGWLPMPDSAAGESGNGCPPCLADRPTLEWRELSRRIRKVGIRNATTTTIAPTGTISIIAGCSSGIEPLFALAYTRKHVLDAQELPEVNPIFARVAQERGFDRPEILAEVAQHGSCREMAEIPAEVRAVFVTAHDVSPTWHVRMQAAFQRYTDNAVSKTINFPHEATVEQVRQAFLLAYSLGCKGLTMYRDGSREAQVLNVGVDKEETRAEAKEGSAEERKVGSLAPRRRPIVTYGSTEKVVLGCGRTLYITINRDEVGLCEVFLQMGKAGGCTAAYSDAVGRLVSLALRSGIEVSAIVKQLKGLRCPSPSWHNGGSTLSCPDAVAKALERAVDSANTTQEQSAVSGEANRALPDMCPECPECGSMVEFVEGCAVCRSCGYSQCS